MDKKDIANNFIHLTNVAIQKTADGYDKSKGCKWLMSRVKTYLESCFGCEASVSVKE
jgi:tubulin polyglutamylase TTLL9